MGAHFDRIICPQCLRRFRDRHALQVHMKRKRHDRIVGDAEQRYADRELRRYNNAKQGDPVA